MGIPIPVRRRLGVNICIYIYIHIYHCNDILIGYNWRFSVETHYVLEPVSNLVSCTCYRCLWNIQHSACLYRNVQLHHESWLRKVDHHLTSEPPRQLHPGHDRVRTSPRLIPSRVCRRIQGSLRNGNSYENTQLDTCTNLLFIYTPDVILIVDEVKQLFRAICTLQGCPSQMKEKIMFRTSKLTIDSGWIW